MTRERESRKSWKGVLKLVARYKLVGRGPQLLILIGSLEQSIRRWQEGTLD